MLQVLSNTRSGVKISIQKNQIWQKVDIKIIENESNN